jgi:uncharacterized OsmC-like protein
MSPEPPLVDLAEVEKFEFTVAFPGTSYAGLTVDEPAPTGHDAGPNPTRTLALAVGHCMSSTLVSTCERAHVPVRPLRTTVRATVGRNDRGRLRVQKLEVEIATGPVNESDRGPFDHCVEVFPDYCTVSGSVRQGIPIEHRVTVP